MTKQTIGPLLAMDNPAVEPPAIDPDRMGQQLHEEDQDQELTYEEWVELQVGPRKVGGRYRIGAHGEEYEVLAIERGPRTEGPTWQITVRWVEDGRIGSHCTGWDADRDRVIGEPVVNR